MTNKQVALDSIDLVEALLKRFRAALQGDTSLRFNEREIGDIADALGFYPDEITELLGMQTEEPEEEDIFAELDIGGTEPAIDYSISFDEFLTEHPEYRDPEIDREIKQHLSKI